MAHNAQNARKIHFKTTPKIGVLKIFGGMALFEFAFSWFVEDEILINNLLDLKG